jgi:heme exporter protein C
MITYLANPQRFLRFERIASPVAAVIGLIAFLTGLWLSLIQSPPAIDHGHGVRLMYVHVPAAYGAMMAYVAITVASIVSFIWRHNLADLAARAFAIPGIAFTFLALATGSLWGKPAWGTWWQWDGRLTSVLVLFFIYMAYMGIWMAFDDKKRASRIAAIFAIVGVINIPIIKWSVDWWNTLHQPASISDAGAPGLPIEILTPLIVMIIAYTALFAWVSLRTMRTEIFAMQRKRQRNSNTGATVSMETL